MAAHKAKSNRNTELINRYSCNAKKKNQTKIKALLLAFNKSK